MNHDEMGALMPTSAVRTLFLAILLTLSAVPALAQEAAQETAPEAAQQEQAARTEGEAVIELGQGDVVTKAEFEQEFERATRALALQQGLPYNEQTRELFERFRADFLEQLAVRNALLAEAEAQGITVTEAEVDAQVTQVRENLGEDQFQQAVQDLGYDTVEAFRESVRQGLLTQRVIDELRAGIEVTDEQVQTFFEENQDRFAGQQLDQVRDQVRAALIDQRLTEQFAGLQQEHGIRTFPERVAVATEPDDGVAGGGEAETPGQSEEPAVPGVPGAGETDTVEGEIEEDVAVPDETQPANEDEVDPNEVPAVEDVEEQQDDPGRQEGEDDQQDDR